jgi:ABC-type polysaccharide/polyol phosphate export permease
MTAPTTGIATSVDSPVEAVVVAPARGSDLHPQKGLIHDAWVLARRGLIHMKRQPEQLSDATIQPIMFVALFAYVFGNAIGLPPGESYREFLMGGIIAQTLVFGSFGTAMSIANDQKNQAVDRFRSLPIARGAVISGYAVANLVKSALPIILMSITGLIIGWRIHSSIAEALLAYLLMFAFAFAMIWVGILLGTAVGTPEGVTGIGFAVIFPVTFIASTFVPLESLPGPLQTIAEWNPVTTLSEALRELFGNYSFEPAPGDPWPSQHPVAYTAIWIVGIIAVCAPLAVRIFAKRNAQ